MNTSYATLTHVSADAATWIAEEVADRCPNVIRCADPFHHVAWATEALDEVRRETWNTAREEGLSAHARDLKHAPYTLWKNPEDLIVRQQKKLAWVSTVNHRLYRAYLLEEQLRQVFALKGKQGKRPLDHWLSWARRSRNPAFVQLAKRITRHHASIDASLEHRPSNGEVESTNTSGVS